MVSSPQYILFLSLHFLVISLCFALPQNPNEASEFLTRFCRQTPDFNFCIELFKDEPPVSISDFKGLAYISLQNARAAAGDANNLIGYLHEKATDPGLRQALEHCSINYGGSVYALGKLVECLDANNFKAAVDFRWVAADNARDCQRVLAEGGGELSLNVRVAKLADILDVLIGLLLNLK